MSYKKYADLTYSFSRLKTLETCERSYYYCYYESNNGWRQDAPQRAKTAYKLKKLQTVEALLGEAIHASAANMISSTGLSTIDFRRMTNKFMRENYRNSLSRKKEWLQNHKIFTMVQEVYYNGCVEMEMQQKIIDKIELCSENFLSSKSFSEIQTNSTILTIDELKEYDYNNIKAYVKIDAIYQNRDSGKYVIVDWKSGRGGAIDVKQVLLYVYFAHKIFNLSVSDIEARLEYLADGESSSFTFTDDDMKMAEKMINEDIFMMQNYLFDVNGNVPLPEVYFKENKSSKCRYCNYRELCFGSLNNVIVLPSQSKASVLV